MSMPKTPLARIVAVALLQVLILLSILAFKQYTVWTSDTIQIRVNTRDPQALIGPEAMPLQFDISRINAGDLPGDDSFGMNAFVELQEGADGIWVAVAVHDGETRAFQRTVLMRAAVWYEPYNPTGSTPYEFHYGIEDVYIREGTAGVPTGSDHTIVMEVRVDRFGDATPLRLLIDGQAFDLQRP